MKDRSDSRYALLRDPDLYDLVGRLALKWVREEAFADDIRNGAYEVAMRLVRMGKGPKPGTERGWTCRVARYHALVELRKRNQGETPLDLDDAPDIPVEDQHTLHAAQMEVERQLEAAEEVASKHPEHVEEVLAPDARTTEGAAKDAAARKRKQRTRTYLASVVSSALAAVLAILWMRGPGAPKPTLPAGSYATLADAAHALAGESCSAKQWVPCLDDLARLKRLDPSKIGPQEQAAWDASVAGLRVEALEKCANGDYMTCLEGLDTALQYDPGGEADPRMQLARSEAEQRLQGSGAKAPPWRSPDAKGVEPLHR